MATRHPLFNDYITLGQFLKEAGLIATGGAAKFYLAETDVFLNGEPENRRGKKLYADDTLEIPREKLSVKFDRASAAEISHHSAQLAEKTQLQKAVKSDKISPKHPVKSDKPKSPFHP
ncbi:MAG: S4 domain-containing protein YaaA [Streptococcaceae bacterium]|jgi:S4 domain protein YaaA|nr:S4 domain-containing protein YaaA [Streptococcaceae bacterium]